MCYVLAAYIRRFLMMCIRTLAAAAVLASITISAHAQSQSADERAIRDLIARYDKGESVPRTDDRILWSGEFKRPIVGSQKREEIPADQQPSARVPGAPSTRVPFSRRRVTTPVRVESRNQGTSPTNSATPNSASACRTANERR